MNVSFPVPSSDTLFDLELLSPVPAPKGPSLGDEIAARATTCTKKASDAIASWAEGERAQSADPRFEGLFVSGYGMDLHRVVNLAVRGDGDLLVRFSSPSKRGGEERVDVLASARWAKDGSLVGSTGTRMIPAALIPDGPVLTDRRVFVGDLHDPLKLVSSRGPWGLFANLWSDQPLGSEHVALLSEMVEIPSSLIADEGAPLPKDLKERLKSLHIASLGKKLAAVNALAPGWDALGAAGNLLQKTWGSEELLPEEENLLAPVLALFTWTFFTGEWDATVEIDSDMGWQSDIRVEATHIPTGARVHGYHDLHEDDADLLDWFNPATRQGKVISLLEKAAQSEASPAPTPMKGNGKAAKVHLASQERLDYLKKDMTVLASVSNTDLQAKALLEASGVLAKAKATEAEVSFAHQGLGEAFAPHGQKVMEEAKALFEVLIWEGEILGKARALAARYDELSGTVQCRDDNSEGVSEMIKHIDSSTRVFEVAPGWWVGKDVDGSLHGAVSCTGFYSGAGRLAEGDETKSLTTHLLEEPGSR